MSEPLQSIPSEEGREQALGREIVRAFLLALRTLRTHGANNDISVAAIRSFAQAINQACAVYGRFELHAVEDFLYFWESRLRPERSDLRLFESLLGELNRRGIGGLVSAVSVHNADVLTLLQVMHRHQGDEDFGDLQHELHVAASPFSLHPHHDLPSGAAPNLTGNVVLNLVDPAGTERTSPDDPPGLPRLHAVPGQLEADDAGSAGGSTGSAGSEGTASSGTGATASAGSPLFPQSGIAVPKSSLHSLAGSGAENQDGHHPGVTRGSPCKRAFFTAVSVYKSIHHGLHLGQPVEVRHAKRTIQNLVDQVLDEEFAVLGLTALKTQDNYAFFHSVNVAVLAIGLGKRVGLTPNQLVELGTGALFHDIGKVRIPASILRKPDRLTEEERAMIQLHPQMGVQELLRIGGLDLQLHPALIGCFEHHICADAGSDGYPRIPAYRPHVYGRIISIADCFDALSTRRVYMARLRSKGQALAWMMDQAGTKFDPTLLKLFVNQVGIHPVGSAVRLRSGRLGVVLRTPEAPDQCSRPIVRIVDPATSTPEPEPLDLSERSPGGDFVDEVLESLEPEDAGIDIARVLA